ncbi:MAG TPA: hypothetical protein VGF45_23295, partial [Polyangia bacterium]
MFGVRTIESELNQRARTGTLFEPCHRLRKRGVGLPLEPARPLRLGEDRGRGPEIGIAAQGALSQAGRIQGATGSVLGAREL